MHVDLAAFGRVLLAGSEHVAECVADFARRLEDAVVVAVCEHGAAASPEPVQGFGDPDRKALQTA